MGYFYKNHQNLSKNERILGTDETQIEQVKEQGRSMVEMLGVLAIVGVLSVGAISGYRYAMNKYRANQVVNELNLLSHQVAIAMMSKNGLSGELKLGEPYDSGKLASSGYEFSCGCGESGTDTTCQNQTKFHFEVKGVSEGVCKELVQMTEHMQDLTSRTDTCETGTTDLQFVFDIPDAAGKGTTGTETPEEAELALDKNCSGRGLFYYGRCNCDLGFIGESCQTTDQTCSGHGTWIGTSCLCESEYSGKNCEFQIDCNNRGNWQSGFNICICSAGYGVHCEFDTNPCKNEGVWTELGCSCKNGFAGSYCESQSNEVCKNEGVWGYIYNDGAPYYACECPSGYKGYDCSIRDE